jgi:hypothetical protein
MRHDRGTTACGNLSKQSARPRRLVRILVAGLLVFTLEGCARSMTVTDSS